MRSGWYNFHVQFERFRSLQSELRGLAHSLVLSNGVGRIERWTWRRKDGTLL
jgi:hypothetical protein